MHISCVLSCFSCTSPIVADSHIHMLINTHIKPPVTQCSWWLSEHIIHIRGLYWSLALNHLRVNFLFTRPSNNLSSFHFPSSVKHWLSINPRVIYSFPEVNYVLHAVLHDRQSLLHCWAVIAIGKLLLKVLISDTCDRSDKRDHVNWMTREGKCFLKKKYRHFLLICRPHN